MELINLTDTGEGVSFCDAVVKGLGRQQGLFFPPVIAPMQDMHALLAMPFVKRSQAILSHLIGDELPRTALNDMVAGAFDFPLPLVPVDKHSYCLELFHGPTLAFKDFGARFMAACLGYIAKHKRVTILTATSGDTGAAVAHAFAGMSNIQVVILYPKGKISPLQEKLFTTLGGNIHTLAVAADFDACQALVKQGFNDPDFAREMQLNSANSINISRLLAQVCYYFEALAQLPGKQRQNSVISVPCGNFGNLTAAAIARALGLPVKRLVAATNINDTVPRFLVSGQWQPRATQATLSNAMDVSQPNNWPRLEAMLARGELPQQALVAEVVDEQQTQVSMRRLAQQGYTSEPHGAVAYYALQRHLAEGETGIFLGTAHPAKFRDSVENILGQPIGLPAALAGVANKPSLSHDLTADFSALKRWMQAHLAND